MNLFHDADRRKILERIQSLGEESPRLWGSMSLPQALAHMRGQLELAVGERKVARVPFPRIPGLSYLIVHHLPFPKGAPTAPELLTSDPADLETERRLLLDAIEKAATRGPEGPFEPHPAFGRLSGNSWGVLMARHLDHHLRQFSV